MSNIEDLKYAINEAFESLTTLTKTPLSEVDDAVNDLYSHLETVRSDFGYVESDHDSMYDRLEEYSNAIDLLEKRGLDDMDLEALLYDWKEIQEKFGTTVAEELEERFDAAELERLRGERKYLERDLENAKQRIVKLERYLQTVRDTADEVLSQGVSFIVGGDGPAQDVR